MGFALGKEPLPRALWLALGSDFFFYLACIKGLPSAPRSSRQRVILKKKIILKKKYLKKPFFAESGSQQRFIRFCREQLSAKD